ncbi:RNA polymerase sigma factor sigC [Acorus calamus]|uniref:RNA polymerase sigma factor sigC n=1 Tax=Acorus calamus TaxID=4465 RepID=A0AAV9EEU7_ACOCL|nr:RNA polymerase sigma factor sigC [Acorus calamus]
MGICFRLDWKWVSSSHSPLPAHSPFRPQPLSLRSREVALELTRASTLYMEDEMLETDHFRDYTCSLGASQSIRKTSAETPELQGRKMSTCHLSHLDTCNSKNMVTLACSTTNENWQFNFLMENLERIQEVFVDPDSVRLERDIMVQIQRLGALKLFHACLSRTCKAPSELNTILPPPKQLEDNHTNAITVPSQKKKRKSRRVRSAEKASSLKSLHEYENPTVSTSTSSSWPTNLSESKTRRLLLARNESDMASGVKEVVKFERIRMKAEEKIGRAVSYAQWAEVAGIDERTLRQRLHFGWYCKDKLLKSTRSLVIYIARNYRGMGVAFDDLIQAGNMGILQGAERFDNTRGYRFATYVQYWIRKSMSMLVARHSRGIHIPIKLEKSIYQIQKARRTFFKVRGRYPMDNEIAELTGLSLANVRLSSKYSRFPGSIERKIGNGMNVKFMEITSDASVMTPGEAVVRQHINREIKELLGGLHPRERQVLMLRHGLEDGKCRSLGEIGRLFKVTKEWIRKIEKAAMAKMRQEEVQERLKHYLQQQ